ncbi:Magnesium and cobalt transport protein CorA [Entamoeba marina]
MNSNSNIIHGTTTPSSTNERDGLVDYIDGIEWIDDYISHLHGKTEEDCIITANGRGFCNEQIDVAMLEEIRKDRNKREKNALWIDVCKDNEPQLIRIGEILQVHPLSVDDWLCDDVQIKSTIFEFFMYYALSDKELGFFRRDERLNIIMKNSVIVTVHPHPLRCINAGMEKAESLYKTSLPSAQWVLYTILMDIMKGYKQCMRAIEEEVGSIEKLIPLMVTYDQNAVLTRLENSKKRTTDLICLISQKKVCQFISITF